MPRIAPIEPETASGKAAHLLDLVQKKLGLTPNLMNTLAASPAALEAYLGFNAALAGGALDAKLREQIALAVAQANACEYCLAAHTALGALAGLTPEDIAASRNAHAADSWRNAALQFARTVVTDRGEVSDAEIAKVRAAGFGDVEITEIVANVVLNIFTNYINHVAQTVVDFPHVEIGVV
jgi:uncharacterized peroxidase-related enzyme